MNRCLPLRRPGAFIGTGSRGQCRRGRRNRSGGEENNSQDLRIVGWYIPGGFENKWKERIFKNVLCTYDVICLSECWIDKEFSMDGPDYKAFIFPRKSKSTKKEARLF